MLVLCLFVLVLSGLRQHHRGMALRSWIYGDGVLRWMMRWRSCTWMRLPTTPTSLATCGSRALRQSGARVSRTSLVSLVVVVVLPAGGGDCDRGSGRDGA